MFLTKSLEYLQLLYLIHKSINKRIKRKWRIKENVKSSHRTLHTRLGREAVMAPSIPLDKRRLCELPGSSTWASLRGNQTWNHDYSLGINNSAGIRCIFMAEVFLSERVRGGRVLFPRNSRWRRAWEDDRILRMPEVSPH